MLKKESARNYIKRWERRFYFSSALRFMIILSRRWRDIHALVILLIVYEVMSQKISTCAQLDMYSALREYKTCGRDSLLPRESKRTHTLVCRLEELAANAMCMDTRCYESCVTHSFSSPPENFNKKPLPAS